MASTGEPPTFSTTEICHESRNPEHKVNQTVSTDSKSHSISTEDSKKPSLITQETDSGYEASPSSVVNELCSFNFEGREHSDSVSSNSDHPAENSPSSNRRNENLDRVTVIENNIVNHDSRDDVDARRSTGRCSNPSPIDTRVVSLPIPIPMSPSSAGNFQAHYRHEFEEQRLFSRSLSTSIEISQPVLSPSTFPFGLSSVALPFSWPTFSRPYGFVVTWWMGPSRTDGPSSRDSVSRTEPPRNSRNRRRQIDSDASSVSSSDGDEVFDDEHTEVFPEAFVPLVSGPANGRHLMSSSSTSASTSSSNNNVRRSRSVSVNLPLNRDQEEAARDIGRTLRRLSDQFNMQMNMRRRGGRRYTMNDIVCFTYRNHFHPPRNGHDDDDFNVNRPPSTDHQQQR